MEKAEKTYIRLMEDLEKANKKIRQDIIAELDSYELSFTDYKGKEKPCSIVSEILLNERKSN